jgi:hypothetical protein
MSKKVRDFPGNFMDFVCGGGGGGAKVNRFEGSGGVSDAILI